MAKTRQELNKLKDEWVYDPIWDIEMTEGFEDHVEELTAFSKEMHDMWRREREAKDDERAAVLGLKRTDPLFGYIDRMEYRVSALESFVFDKCNGDNPPWGYLNDRVKELDRKINRII